MEFSSDKLLILQLYIYIHQVEHEVATLDPQFLNSELEHLLYGLLIDPPCIFPGL